MGKCYSKNTVNAVYSSNIKFETFKADEQQCNLLEHDSLSSNADKFDLQRKILSSNESEQVKNLNEVLNCHELNVSDSQLINNNNNSIKNEKENNNNVDNHNDEKKNLFKKNENQCFEENNRSLTFSSKSNDSCNNDNGKIPNKTDINESNEVKYVNNNECDKLNSCKKSNFCTKNSKRLLIKGVLSFSQQNNFENKVEDIVYKESFSNLEDDSNFLKHSYTLSSNNDRKEALHDDLQINNSNDINIENELIEDVLSKNCIGYVCKKGFKPESPNQDDFFIANVEDWALYGVFDGHGPYGHDISNYIQRELPLLICENNYFLTEPTIALKKAFIEVNNKVEALSNLNSNCFGTTMTSKTLRYDSNCSSFEGNDLNSLNLCNSLASNQTFLNERKYEINSSLSGSTATIVLYKKREKKLYVANVGDSRAVLARRSSQGDHLEAINLTKDHKPNNEAERRRIVDCGGQVRRLDGDIPYRVFLKGKLYPGLAMSRAIGDSVGSQAGIIPDPDVSVYTLDEDRDVFLLLCSDGVWEFISSQDAVNIVHSFSRNEVQKAVECLAREAWERWIAEEGNVVDDITAQAIYLWPMIEGA